MKIAYVILLPNTSYYHKYVIYYPISVFTIFYLLRIIIWVRTTKRVKCLLLCWRGNARTQMNKQIKKFLAVFSSHNEKSIHKLFSFDINNNGVCNLFKKNILQYFERKSDYAMYCFYMLLNLLYNNSVWHVIDRKKTPCKPNSAL